MNAGRLSMVLLAGALSAACGSSPTLEDDLFPDTGRRAPDDDGNVLHGPYATGSRFRVGVVGLDPDECDGLRFESGDEAVLSVAPDEEDACRARVTAGAPGEATLRVIEDGDELRAARVEVATATRATIHPRGWVRAGLPEANESWEEAKVLAGATATFTVRWWDDAGRELSAHELLVTTANDGLGLGPAFGQPAIVDALQVTPRATGLHTAEVGTAEERFATIEITAVSADDLAALDLVPGEIAGETDERSVLVAVARDDAGDPVLGVEPQWNVDGEPVLDDESTVVRGDLFLYAEGDPEHAVQAEYPGLTASDTVAFEGEPSVESSNGCNSAPGAPATSAVLVVAAAMLAKLRRRFGPSRQRRSE